MEYIIGIALLIVGFVIGIAIRGLIDKKRQIPEVYEGFENPAIENFLNQKEEEPLWDIVYVLRNDIDDSPEELRYSLRSLENFKYSKVWFAGGQSKFLQPDRVLPIDQRGLTKWDKVCYTLRQICENEEVSENFWLFNDDFFVMAPNKQYHAYTDGDLAFRILMLEDRLKKRSSYSSLLRECLMFLKRQGLPTVNYALHLPMLINKEKALEVLNLYPNISNFKNIYGNYVKAEAKLINDVKYSDNSRPIDKTLPYISTEEGSFLNGVVGDYIRESFPNKSRFEI